MMSRPILCLSLILGAVSLLGAATPPPANWDTVIIQPVKTSIYVGSVTLTASEFHREGDKYLATYEAKVWPWFFWNETGHITINLSTADLQKLEKGERMEFKGDAFNHKNKPRFVTGYAERADASSGKIKVRIGVDDTALVFNSTYRFGTK